jgi:tetratricopeptide (TPR) repeat protein
MKYTLTFILASNLFLSACNHKEEDYYKAGLAKYESEDYKGAIVDYTKAIEINPDNAETYYNRGLAKDDLEDYKAAIADYTKAIDLNPKYIDA